MNHCRFFQLTTKYKWFLQKGRWIRLCKYRYKNLASFKQTKFSSKWFSPCCKKQKQRKRLMMIIGLKFWSHIMLIKINKGSLFASEMKLSVVWTIATYVNGTVPILFFKILRLSIRCFRVIVGFYWILDFTNYVNVCFEHYFLISSVSKLELLSKHTWTLRVSTGGLPITLSF